MTQLATNGVKAMTTLLVPEPDKGEELLQALRALRPEFVRQLGCLECVVARDIDVPDRFLVLTAWRDVASLRAHLASEPFQILLGAARLLGAPAEFRTTTSDSVLVSSPF